MSRNRWIFTSACFSIALLLVTTGCQAVATEYQVISTSVVAREPACMPAMTRAPNGDILVAYSTVWEPFPPGGTLHLVRSTDQGRTWSKPRLLWKPEPGRGIHLGSGMTTLRDGTILLPCTYCLIHKHKNLPPEEIRLRKIYNTKDLRNQRSIFLLASRDNGESWSGHMIYKPSEGQWVLGFGRIIELADGQLLYPCYWGMPDETQTHNKWRAHGLLRSSDHGKTWKLEEMPQPWNSEISPLLLSDGTILAILRNNGTGGWPRRIFAQIRSTDSGRTWTKPASTDVRGQMPELLQTTSGRILMGVGLEGLTDSVFMYGNKERNSFATLFISDDDGKSWNKDLAFAQAEPGSTIVAGSSPVMVPLEDGRVVVVVQAIDLAKKDHLLAGLSADLSLIANVIEPVKQ